MCEILRCSSLVCWIESDPESNHVQWDCTVHNPCVVQSTGLVTNQIAVMCTGFISNLIISNIIGSRQRPRESCLNSYRNVLSQQSNQIFPLLNLLLYWTWKIFLYQLTRILFWSSLSRFSC